MCKVISVANIKGGVAKTTTAANLGVGLVKRGRRVLLVDLDPQGSLSLGLGIRNNKELPYTVSTVIQKVINEIEISEGEGVIHNDEGVDILPSNHSLRAVEQQLDEVMSKEHILEEYIDSIREKYDYIIIDCNPGVDNLILNALTCCDSVLIPSPPEYLCVEGLLEDFGNPITQERQNYLRRQRLKRRISALQMMTWEKAVQRRNSVTISGRLQP